MGGGGLGVGVGWATDNLNINKLWVQIKKGGSEKCSQVKSGNPISLIMGVPNKTSLHHLDIVEEYMCVYLCI